MLTKQDIKYVANLARINLNEEETENLSKQLADILSYIDKLSQLDVSKIEPMSHVLYLKNVFRTDEVKPSLPAPKVVKLSKFSDKKFFKVPRIIDE